jgi:hypothetical protein
MDLMQQHEKAYCLLFVDRDSASLELKLMPGEHRIIIWMIQDPG